MKRLFFLFFPLFFFFHIDVLASSSYRLPINNFVSFSSASYSSSNGFTFSGSSSGSASGTVNNSGDTANYVVFFKTNTSVSDALNVSLSNQYTNTLVGSFPQASRLDLPLTSVPFSSSVWLLSTGDSYVYADGFYISSTVLEPVAMSFGNGSSIIDFSFGSGPFSGTGSFDNISFYLPLFMSVEFDDTTFDGSEYSLSLVVRGISSLITYTGPSTSMIFDQIICSTGDVLSGAFVSGNLYIYGNIHFSPVSHYNYLYLIGNLIIPKGNNITVKNGSYVPTNTFMNLFPLGDSLILDSLNSANGANSGLNNMNSQVSSALSDYQRDTDTSTQFGNISDSFFDLDTSIFTSVASTSTLFSACVTAIFSALGDFSTVLTLFLVFVLVGTVIGIVRNRGD